MATEEKLLRVITFDGKHSNYHPWLVKFLAHARRKGFAELLLSKAAIPKESKILALHTSSDVDDKILVSYYEKILLGFDKLILLRLAVRLCLVW